MIHLKKRTRKSRLGVLVILLLWALAVPTAQGKGLEGVLNVNTATPEQLTLLPGIGEAKAEAIVRQRRIKPFTSLDDLAAVKGLGKKRLEALKPYVSFSGPSTAKKTDHRPSPTPAQP